MVPSLWSAHACFSPEAMAVKPVTTAGSVVGSAAARPMMSSVAQRSAPPARRQLMCASSLAGGNCDLASDDIASRELRRRHRHNATHGITGGDALDQRSRRLRQRPATVPCVPRCNRSRALPQASTRHTGPALTTHRRVPQSSHPRNQAPAAPEHQQQQPAPREPHRQAAQQSLPKSDREAVDS